MQITKEQEKELRDICEFYIKDKKMIDAFKVGIRNFISKLNPDNTSKSISLDDYIKSLVNELLDERRERRNIQHRTDGHRITNDSVRDDIS
jgi:hypothetical protein